MPPAFAVPRSVSGLPPAQRDLVAGHVDVMFDAPGKCFCAHQGRQRSRRLGGQVRRASRQRLNIPTISETIPGFVHIDWLALVAPPGTPPKSPPCSQLPIAETLKLPDVAGRIAAFSSHAIGVTRRARGFARA